MSITGSCECGAVTYSVQGPLRDVTICHCGQCQRTSGHAWASTSVPADQLTLTNDAGSNGAGLKWYPSSENARRGFCTECGSSLFFEVTGENRTAIGTGTLHSTNGLKTTKHIFLADKGDHYDIACAAPQFEHYD